MKNRMLQAEEELVEGFSDEGYGWDGNKHEKAAAKIAVLRPWSERLALAERYGSFTKADKVFAGSWFCCAVGEKCKNKDFNSLNIDSETSGLLDAFGMDFMSAVQRDDVREAKVMYRKINAIKLPRSAFQGTMSETVREDN